MSDSKTRAEFMTSSQIAKYKDNGSPARTHQNMIDMFGVARPGKTAKDRASQNKGQSHG